MQPSPGGSRNTSGGGGGGGGGGGLARFRSAPATWLAALLEEEEEDPLKQNQNLTQLLTSNAPSSRNPVPFNDSSAAVEPVTKGVFLTMDSLQIMSTCRQIWRFHLLVKGLESLISCRNPSARYPPPSKGALTGSLRASTLMEMDTLLEESVPCRIRAKRGCATHPRSIAERVRRTRISDRIRKLQDLVPNMDKISTWKNKYDYNFIAMMLLVLTENLASLSE
ncbi:hypothetical protein OIU76_016159 [Salix suchowensis]|nr:hypothetical protein OIU76_016159 [Salix suchowensis]